MRILVVIPARGGSKGIPRKNLRLLGGRPLIYYSINNALNSKYDLDVYVSSDDDEIINIAEKFGANTHKRNVDISGDETTLDPVIYDCYKYSQFHQKTEYSLIITIQPTSPLLSIKSLDLAIDKMIKQPEIDTLIAARDATHLSWRFENGKYVPNYVKRVNRQYLTPEFTETGGFLITRDSVISKSSRIGGNTQLQILKGGEEIDIDTYEDWSLCEYYLKKKQVLFVVRGNQEVGLGHVYNTLLIANDILNHDVRFLVTKDSELAFKTINSKNYPVIIQNKNDIIEDIKILNPDVVINDILDTEENYVATLKRLGFKVVNFEDLGRGSFHADLVINAIYPEKNSPVNHYFGKDFFVLRDEFIYSKTKIVKKDVSEVVLTFGGVDPNNYTSKVLLSIYDYCDEKNIKITVVTGYGFNQFQTLDMFENIEIIKNTSRISDYIYRADLIFTSAGRTIYEIASICTPAIVLEQNDRESTHFFASKKFGFSNLGLGFKLSNQQILDEFIKMVSSYELRLNMNKLMRSHELRSGRRKVRELINKYIL